MDNQAPQIASDLQKPPPSPWLRKYGGQTRTVFNNPNEPATHSGFAPLFPQLHPTWYAEDSTAFSHAEPYPKPSDHGLDMLFGTEKSQIDLNRGLTTWEIATLRQHLVNGWPGGHRQMDPTIPHDLEHGHCVDVDENGWHPVFERNKWYDFRVPIVDGKIIPHPLPGIDPADVWSVDVPRLWEELRVSVELADRWLRHMATGLWLNHMVHEDWVEWMEAGPNWDDLNNPRFLGPNMKVWKIPAQGKDYDSEKTLGIIAEQLAPRLVWTFVDHGHHPYDAADKDDFYGRTDRHWDGGEEPEEDTPVADRPLPFITIYLHLRPLRVLLNPKSTLAERFQARWSLAMTMLHELMHAINYTRHINMVEPPSEPYYDQEWSRELGMSGIQSFFGTDFHEAPLTDTAAHSGYQYGMSTVNFPSAPGNLPVDTVNNALVSYIGKVDAVSPLPAAWSASTLLESFYTTHVQKYGLAAFHAPKLFSSHRIFRGFYSDVTRAQPITTVPTATAIPTLDETAATLADLQARRLAWARLRPWYADAHRLWRHTPYANVSARSVVARFTDAYRRYRHSSTPNEALRAEREAHVATSGMYYWLCLHRPRPQDEDGGIPPRDWVFVVLALLMQVVLPARRGTGYENDSREVGNAWFPSRAAVSGTQRVWRFKEKRRVWTQLGRVYSLPDRHMEPHVVRDARGEVVEYVTNRTFLLETALEIKQSYERFEPVPLPLSVALENELVSLFGQNGFAEEEDEEEEWLDWTFEFPAYSSQFVTRDAEGGYVPWSELPPPPGGPPAQGGSGQGHAQASMAQIVGKGRHRSKSRAVRRPTRYFTVSEVGESISDDGTKRTWALLPDEEGGYDVFDVGSILDNDPSLDVETVFERTELGRQIVSQKVVDALDAEGHRPYGKLLTWKHEQEVSEHDGQDGRDMWCVVGNFVYNITDFPFHSEPEKVALIAIATKSKPPREALTGLNIASLLARLAPHKCGFLRQAPGMAPPRQRAFTLRELGRYIYPQLGMYCAIGGDVYNLGRYLDSHPGGAQILYEYAGRDATDAFQQAHPDWVETLQQNRALKVGRLVAERSRRDIDEYEIALLNRVFCITSLFDENEQLFSALWPYHGTDATNALKREEAPYALRQLLSRDNLVCAKLVSGTRRHIKESELHSHNHIPSKAGRREQPGVGDNDWRVWVSVAEGGGSRKQMVYDVTTLIMFGGSELEQELRPWLGKRIRDRGLADMLRSRHESFIIGELVGVSRSSDSHRNLASSKRQVDDLDDSDVEVVGPSKRFGSRSQR